MRCGGHVGGTGGKPIARCSGVRRHMLTNMCPYNYERDRRAQERAWRLAEGDPMTCRRERERAGCAHETTEQVLKQLGRIRAVT